MIPNPLERNLISWFMRRTTPTAVRRVAELPIALASSVGQVRKENQDRVSAFRFEDYSGRQFLAVVLCDGMGGMADGAKCASQAMSYFICSVLENANRMHPEQCLATAAMYANERIFAEYRGSGGATLSAILCMSHRSDTYWVNLGDSRIYRYAPKGLQQLTVDDTVAGQLAREPDTYHGRNELLQFVGVGPIAEPHVGRQEETGDPAIYLISSDGIHFLPSKMLHQINAHASEPAIAAKRLLDLALWCGGHDNASLMVGEFSSDILGPLPDILEDSLEVWDAYGEARFFGFRSAFEKVTQRQIYQHVQDQDLLAPVIEAQSRVVMPTNFVSVKKTTEAKQVRENIVKPASKRKRSSKKISEKEILKDESRDDGPPQLLIHFKKKDETP